MRAILFYFSLITAVILLLVSCSKSENDILKEVSGVWKIANESTLMEIQLTTSEKYIKAGDLQNIPVNIKTVDIENSTINLSITDQEGNEQIWSFKQNWSDDEKSFTLIWTSHDGSQFNLEFVRNI